MRRTVLVATFMVTMVGLAACGSSSTAKTGAGGSITQTTDTSSYKMVLDIGPRETMYTQAQAQAQHPPGGE